jgi:hypothetical protein
MYLLEYCYMLTCSRQIKELGMALDTEPERYGTRAIAITAVTLAVVTMSKLQANNAVSSSDVEQIFEAALGSLEAILGPTDPAADEARKFVALIHQAAIAAGS